ncbi:hypothetical protein D6T64_16060 [Cryobacterium melibiosiphilum]|uniref:Uncharacterized protein n=1 Tax=Cryobacterium melibiosiphilum TaxID=995039 RepID=A0A3A5MDL1_9MICO|nr:hypothetical protein D6T64_16060 [Cryobacterium melibiosiphilum]
MVLVVALGVLADLVAILLDPPLLVLALALGMLLAMREVSEHVPTNRLTVDDARDAARIVGLHIATTLDNRRDAVGTPVPGRSLH